MTFIIAQTKPTIGIFDGGLDPDDFTFHSGYDTLKYETTGVYTMTVNYANYYQFNPGGLGFPDTYNHYLGESINHNLAYAPEYAGYILFDSPLEAVQAPFVQADFVFFAQLNIYVDDTKIYFTYHSQIEANSGTIDIDFGWRLFKNDTGLL